MAGEFAETLRHTRNYFGANLATKALGFLSIPVITRLLSPGDYGLSTVFIGYVAVVVPMLTLNTHSALGRYYYEGRPDFAGFVGTSVIVCGICLVATSVILVAFRARVAQWANVPVMLVMLMIPLAVFQVGTSAFEQIYQPQKQSRKLALRQILQSYLSFGVSVALILMMRDRKYLGIIYAQLAVGAIFFVYYLVELRPYFRLSFSRESVGYILHYALPLLPYALSSVILSQFDRLFVNGSSGSADAGLYSFAASIGMLVAVFASSAYQAWIPDYFALMDARNLPDVEIGATRLFRLICGAGLALVLFSREIGMILAAPSFHGSLGLVPVMVLGNLFGAAYQIYGWGFGYVRRTFFLSAVVLVSGIVNVVLNAVLVGAFGYRAAAYATAASYLVMALLGWLANLVFLRQYCPSILIVLKPLALVVPFFAAYLGLVAWSPYWMVSLAIKVGLLSLYAGALVLFRIGRPAARDA